MRFGDVRSRRNRREGDGLTVDEVQELRTDVDSGGEDTRGHVPKLGRLRVKRADQERRIHEATSEVSLGKRGATEVPGLTDKL